MHNFPFGVGIVACGTAFGFGWVAATLTPQQPEAALPTAPFIPAPSSGAEGSEWCSKLENSENRGRQHLGKRDQRDQTGSTGKKPTMEDEDSATGLNSERLILTQKDVVSAFHAAIEQYRKDCNQREQPATDKKLAAAGEGSANVLNYEHPVRTYADVSATIRAALEQDREERDRHERQLRDGPYGDFNYDVNRMSERVSGVSESQRLQYMYILASRRQTGNLLEQRLHAKEIAQDEFENGMRMARDYEDQSLRQILDTRQIQDYQAYRDGSADAKGNSDLPLPEACSDAEPR